MDALFNLFKIKFDTMDALLNHKNTITHDSTINIYFNLEPIWKLVLNKNNENFLRTRNNTRIIETAANIINIAAHYRLWCKKHKLKSRIILYTPSFDKIPYKNMAFNSKYRAFSLFKYNDDTNYFICQETIRESIQMAKTILEYIDDVYLIEGYSTEPSLIPLICESKFRSDKDINFIISTDVYDFQYANYDFYVFRPKKEDTFLIRKGSLIDTIKSIEGIKNPTKVSDELYSFIISIIGDRNRNIEKIKKLGLSSILTLISKAIDNDLITSTSTSIELLVKSLKEEHRNDVLNNFYCVDLGFQLATLPMPSKLKIDYQLKNRFDNDSLIKLNNSYFNEFPIRLFELIKEPVQSSPKKRNPFQTSSLKEK